MSEITTLKIIEAPELKSVEPSRAKQIQATFEPMVLMLEDFEARYNEIVAQEITEEITKQAKRLRLDISKVRIEAEKVRKAQKEEFLRAGKAIDGVANILKWAVTEKENKLKEIERHFEILEQQRLEALQAQRAEELSPYVEDAHERDLAKMEEDVWNAYLQTKINDYNARIEAEKKAEEERLERERIAKLHEERKSKILDYYQFWTAEDKSQNFGQITDKAFKDIVKRLIESKKKFDAEQEQIRIENERLAKEKAEAEERARIERAKAEAERRAQEEKLRQEREERERLERELEAKKEAERLEAERKKKEAEKRAKAPIKKQLTLWVDEFVAPKSPVENEKTQLIKQKFEAFKKWAKQEIENI
ncbi:hypothetical protein ACQ1PF_09670 [Ornithobacterium rhinotracheale]